MKPDSLYLARAWRGLFLLFAAGLPLSFAGCTPAEDTAPATALPEHASRAHQEAAPGQGGLRVLRTWTRETIAGVPVAGVYFTVENLAAAADALLGGTSPVADRAELHLTISQDGTFRMRPSGEIALAAGGSLTAQPGGLHLMLTGLHQPLRAGMRIPLTLQFRNAGAVVVEVEVLPIAATGPGEPGKHDHEVHANAAH